MKNWSKLAPGVCRARDDGLVVVKGTDRAPIAATLLLVGGILVMGGFMAIPITWYATPRFWAAVSAAGVSVALLAQGLSFRLLMDASELRLVRKAFGIPYAWHCAQLQRVEIGEVAPGDFGAVGIWPLRRHAQIYLPMRSQGEEDVCWDFGTDAASSRIIRSLLPDYLEWTRTNQEQGIDFAALVGKLPRAARVLTASPSQIVCIETGKDPAASRVLVVYRNLGCYELGRQDEQSRERSGIAELLQREVAWED